MTWKKGESGNPAGMLTAEWRKKLNQALAQAGKEHGVNFLQHCVNLAYEGDSGMAREILRKIIPDMKDVAVSAPGLGDGVRQLFAGIYQAVQEGRGMPDARSKKQVLADARRARKTPSALPAPPGPVPWEDDVAQVIEAVLVEDAENEEE